MFEKAQWSTESNIFEGITFLSSFAQPQNSLSSFEGVAAGKKRYFLEDNRRKKKKSIYTATSRHL